MLVIVVELVTLLCLNKAIINILEVGVTICEQMLYHWNMGIASLIAAQGRGSHP
jgi:hypothetical protein